GPRDADDGGDRRRDLVAGRARPQRTLRGRDESCDGNVMPTGEEERGSAPAEFVLVGLLLTALTLGILQFGLAAYTRNVVQDAAVEGAFHAALADTTTAEAEQRAREVVTRALGRDVVDWAVIAPQTKGGVEFVSVDLAATYPLVGLFGIPAGSLVSARAPVEQVG